MILKKESKKSLGLDLLNNIIIFLLIGLIPATTFADPVMGDVILPPASFTRIENPDTLVNIGLSDASVAWCYDNQANAILISAPARERANCEISLIYKLEKQRVKYEFELDKLKLRIDTINEQNSEINAVKDREIDRLTAAAIERPNSHSMLWASGGFVVGIATTLAIVFSVK